MTLPSLNNLEWPSHTKTGTSIITMDPGKSLFILLISAVNVSGVEKSNQETANSELGNELVSSWKSGMWGKTTEVGLHKIPFAISLSIFMSVFICSESAFRFFVSPD